MLLYVSDIRAGGSLQKEEKLDPQAIFNPPTDAGVFKSPIKASVIAQMTQGDIYVKGDVETDLTLKCARCLKQFKRPFQGTFSQTFNPDLERIDVSGDIKETVLIDMPIKPLCADSCKGLCANCGVDLNTQECKCAESKDSPLKKQLGNFPFQKS